MSRAHVAAELDSWMMDNVDSRGGSEPRFGSSSARARSAAGGPASSTPLWYEPTFGAAISSGAGASEPIARNEPPRTRDSDGSKESSRRRDFQDFNEYDTKASPRLSKLQAMLTAELQEDSKSFASNTVASLARQYDGLQDSRSPRHELATISNGADPTVKAMKIQLGDMQKQIDDLSKASQRAIRKVELQAEDSEGFEERMKTFVRQLYDKLEQNLKKLRQDHDTFVQKMLVNDADVHKRLEQVCADVTKAVERNTQPLNSEIRRLQGEIQTFQSHTPPALKEYMAKASEEMKDAWDQMLDHHRKTKECLDRESRERRESQDVFEQSVQKLFQKDRNDRDLTNSSLHAHLCSVENAVENYKEHLQDLPALRKKIISMEEKMHDHVSRHNDDLELQLKVPLERLRESERKLEQMQNSIREESLARTSMAEEIDGLLKAERGKIAKMLTDKAVADHQEFEALAKEVHEKLDQERLEREAAVESFHDLHARHKTTVHDRISGVEGETESQGLELQGLMRAVKDLQEKERKLEDSLVQCIRETKRELVLSIEDEKRAREQADSLFEDHLGFLEETHERMRELAVARPPPRSMRALTHVPEEPRSLMDNRSPTSGNHFSPRAVSDAAYARPVSDYGEPRSFNSPEGDRPRTFKELRAAREGGGSRVQTPRGSLSEAPSRQRSEYGD